MSAPVPAEVTRRAAEWVVQLRSPDRPAGSFSEFTDWLRASPMHVAEYLRAIELWEALGDSDLEPAVNLDQLVSEARQPGVTPLPIGCLAVRRETRPAAALVRRAAAIAVCTLLLGVAWITWHRLAPLELTTGIGEQRSTVLPDGSIVELNTRSKVVVRYSASQRRIELVRGEAFFEVEHNPARPFVVVTDVATATAVGTRFSVYRAAKGTIVTVEEGKVLVRDIDRGTAGRSPDTKGVEVESGIQAEAAPRRPVEMHRADVRQWLAWRQRRLIFEGTPLEEVIAEFNRYNPIPLVIVDPRLGGRRISGVFGANDPQSLVDFLTKVDHIQVISDSRTIRIGEDASR